MFSLRTRSAALSSNVAIGAAAAFGLCAITLSFALDARIAAPSASVVVDASLGLRGTIAPDDHPYRSAPIVAEPAKASRLARL